MKRNHAIGGDARFGFEVYVRTVSPQNAFKTLSKPFKRSFKGPLKGPLKDLLKVL